MMHDDHLFSEVGAVVNLLSRCNHLLQLHSELLRVLTSLHPVTVHRVSEIWSLVWRLINWLGPLDSVVKVRPVLGLMITTDLEMLQLLGFLDCVKLLVVVFSSCIVKLMKVF